jgi:hypothetical protein
VSKKWEKMMGVMYAYGSQHVTVKQLGLWLHLMPKEKEVWRRRLFSAEKKRFLTKKTLVEWPGLPDGLFSNKNSQFG